MKSKFTERGQALIIIALAAIGLFGITGLAIDGSAKYSDRRHAQNAADTSALAGALALVNKDPEWKLAALDRASENGYDNNLTTNTVEVYACNEDESSCGPYAGLNSYIQVIITSHVSTYFSRVIGIGETVNTVQAVTYWSKKGPMYPGQTIIQYKPTGTGCPGEFIVGGSGTVTIDGGGLFVNSDNSGQGACAAFTQAGCQTELNVINGNISAVGQIYTDPCNGNDMINATEVEGADPMAFPPEPLDPPAECDMDYGLVSNDSARGLSYIFPGKYDSIPPAAATQNRIIMAPGNYCVYEVLRVTNSTRLLQGENVFIYIKHGRTSPLSIQGGEMVMDAPDVGDYQGLLFYIDPGPIENGAYVDSSDNCVINGGADDYFTGSIIAPNCSFTINGGGNPDGFHAQLIAYEVKLDGNNDLTFTYDAGKIAISQPKIGIMR